MTDQLGRLVSVPPREIWTNEAYDFTPWLAEEQNLELLGATLGMELELEASEKEVGPYRADIVCRDTADGSWVLVENQLEATNHTHLGQILTYAAGLNAVTVVWIATRFTDEHRAAMDWLNEISGDEVEFFGLEVEAWKIGDSQPAPKFNVVAKPNDWTKGGGRSQAIRSAELSETKRLQLDFWHGFREYVLDQDSTPIKPRKPQPQLWMDFAIGRTGFHLSGNVSTYNNAQDTYDLGEVRAEFVITAADAPRYFRVLQKSRTEIEQEVGESLTWHSKEGTNMCRAYLVRDADVSDPDAWPELFEWLLARLEIMHGAFAPRALNLVLPPPDETSVVEEPQEVDLHESTAESSMDA